MASVTELYKEAAESLVNSNRIYTLEEVLILAFGNPFRKLSETEIAAFEQWLEDSGYYECEICGNWTLYDCLDCASKLCIECGLHEDDCNCDEDEDD